MRAWKFILGFQNCQVLQNLPEGLRDLRARGLREDWGTVHPLLEADWDVEIGVEKTHQVLLRNCSEDSYRRS